jgi:4-hydroxybenzoate decarboxylase
MPYDDLRQFLNLLEENGQLVRIKDLVLPEPDVTAAAHAALRLGSGAPALLFENIRGYKNQLTLNVHG